MAMYSQLLRSMALAKLGGSVMLGSRHSSEEKRREALQGIVTQMATLHGLPQKIGQILSLKELETPDNEYIKLTGAGRMQPAQQGKAWIEEALGLPLSDVFSELSDDAFTASIGQVHRGVLNNGQKVAVKVQYPEVRHSIEGDLAALGWLTTPISSKRSGFNLEDYKSVLRESLLSELDYDKERQALERFSWRLEEESQIVIPRPVPEYCTSTVLTMSWLEGELFDKTLTWSENHRTSIARLMLRFFLRSWLEWGEIHADPNPGNFRFLRTEGDVRLGIVDFGCVQQLSNEERNALTELLDYRSVSNPLVLFDIYTRLGFDSDLLSPMFKKLPDLTQALFAPFTSSRWFDLSSWDLSTQIENILGEDRWNFRFAGPARLLHLIRALSGVIQYTKSLNVRLHWADELEEVLSRCPSRSEQIGACLRSHSSLEPAQEKGLDPSKRLKIKVTEGGKDKVQLSFGIGALESLGALMPPDLLEKLKNQNIDPQAIADDRLSKGCIPGQLFELRESEKCVKVWIE